ncbi:MAG: hypothetical protein GX558_05095 [Clostridiales bacterium]|nr:hypothetical protein [Clostridiales bacterium]
MLRRFRPWAAVAFTLLVALDPASALAAGHRALSSWAQTVAPALLPFMVVLPALTGPEMRRALGRPLGRLMRPLFGCPGEAAAAAAIGWLAGSPAGAAAMAHMADGMTRAELTRGALLASGASPMFLLSAVGAGMLGAPVAGWLLVRAQLGAVLIAGLALRRAPLAGDMPAGPAEPEGDAEVRPVRAAVLNVLFIGGYMAFFAVLARQAALLMGGRMEAPLLMVMELAGGCEAAAALPIGLNDRLVLTGAIAAFGGASVFMQCMAYLRRLGVSPAGYLAGKLMQALVAAALVRVQLQVLTAMPAAMPAATVGRRGDPAAIAALIAAGLLLLAMAAAALRWRGPEK